MLMRVENKLQLLLQWRSKDFALGGVLVGSGGRAPRRRRALGSEGKAPIRWRLGVWRQGQRWAIFAYFGQNSYFEAITHQLKAFMKQSKRTK